MKTNLARIRYDAGYTMHALGEELGCTTGAIYAWENGKSTRPQPAVARRLREFFNIPLAELFAPDPPEAEREEVERQVRESRSMLYDLLREGPKAVKVIKAEAERRELTWCMVKYAKAALDVETRRISGAWIWMLPTTKRRPTHNAWTS